jgi:hypothetical protein
MRKYETAYKVPGLLKAVGVIKNKESLRICHNQEEPRDSTDE